VKREQILKRQFPTQLYLLPLLFAILLSSCDLFTGPKVDVFQQISDEVDWANAAKLTVRLDYPNAWGTSNPPQGSLAPAMDIRKNYEFSVEFTPDTAYTLTAWLAYRTSDLDGMENNWLDDPTAIEAEGVQSLGPGEVTLPDSIPSGGKFNFNIHTTEPVTIIPWCLTQPRITRTEPRNRPNPTDQPYARATDIVLYFNGALNVGTVRFANTETDDGIWITSKHGDDDIKNNIDEKWYNPPEYSTTGGFFTVTMTVNTLPPEGSLMTVTVKGIQNAQKEPMDGEYSFSWNTSSAAAVYLTKYKAEYNSENITVTYTPLNADSVVTYYRLNKGANIFFNNDVIPDVPEPDAGSVRNGIPVSGIREYDIVIELYLEGIMEHRTTFKMWNIPGMTIEMIRTEDNEETNTAFLDNTLDQTEIITRLNGSYANFILTSNISLNNWKPVDITDKNFYGNGHTITINGITPDANTGLFGAVKGASSANPAVVRDLTVNYNDVGVTSDSALSNFGGLSGQLGAYTKVTNVLITGKFDVTQASSEANSEIRAGGIIGYVNYAAASATTEINNVYSALELSVTNSQASGNIFAGGIVGDVLITASGSSMSLSNASVAGIVDAKNSAEPSTGSVFIGGAAGRYRTSAVLQNVDVYTTLKIYVKSETANPDNMKETIYICGGIIGQISSGGIDYCNFKGKIEFSEKYSVNIRTYIGGLLGGIGRQYGAGGWISDDDITPGVNQSVNVSNSTAYGDISFINISNGSCFLGGVCATTNGHSALGSGGNTTDPTYPITFDNCEYRDGTISINCSGGGNIGGFVGEIMATTFTNCKTSAGLIELNNTSTSGSYSVGGFIGMSRTDIKGCFSNSPIEITIKLTSATGSVSLWVGGFIGRLTRLSSEGYTSGSATISNCYSGGSVFAKVDNSNSNGYNLYAGGFAGAMEDFVRIINSYALGNVLADKTNSSSGTVNVYAGGFVGCIKVGDIGTGNAVAGYAVERCFSKGFANAMANGTTNTNVYAGGLVGNKPQNGYVRNSAALGSFVSVKGGSSRSLGRIISSVAINSHFVNNYASSSMTLFTINSYSTNSGQITSAGDGADGKDGNVIMDSLFYSQNTWTSTLEFNKDPFPTYSNFTRPYDQPWSFSGIVDRGYPLLIGEDGKAMGGQQ